MKHLFYNFQTNARWLFAALMLLLGVPLFSQQNLHGTAGNERLGVVKTVGTDFYATGISTVGTTPFATFSRFSATGVEAWTLRIDTFSQINDFLQTDDGNFLLVGSSGPYTVGANNRSWAASVSPTGGLLAFRFYDQCLFRETFTRVARNPNQTNLARRYVILGIRNQGTSSSSDDWTTLYECNASGLIASTRHITTPGDIQLQSTLLPLAGGGFAIGGAIGATARMARFDQNLLANGGWTINNLSVSNINWMIEKADAGGQSTIVWTGVTLNGEGIFSRNNTATGATLWSVRGSAGSYFWRVLEHGGHYYVTTGVTVGSVANAEFRVMRFTENAAQTAVTLDWVRAIKGPETAIGLMFLAPRAGGLAHADGRAGAPNTLGGDDGFLALTDLELATCETQNFTTPTVAAVQLATTLGQVTTTDAQIAPVNFNKSSSLDWATAELCPNPCASAWTFEQDNSCGLIQFTDLSAGPAPLTYLWTFGDGTTSTLQNPAHQYPLLGGPNWVACLTVTGANGCTNTVCDTIEVQFAAVPPKINCPQGGPFMGFADANCAANVLVPGPLFLHSICAQNVNDQCIRNDGAAIGAPYPKGTTTVTCTAMDNFGSASCAYQVIVKDTTRPRLTCPQNVSLTIGFNPNGKCQTQVAGLAPTFSDNCPMAVLTFSIMGATVLSGTGDASGQTFSEGISTVTYTVTDMSGNVSTCSFTVEIRCICSQNNCLDFDGTDDLVTAPSAIGATPTAFSVGLWFRDDLVNGGPIDNILHRLFGWGGANRFELGDQDGVLTFYSNPSGLVFSTTNIRDGQWHHVATTFSSGTTNVFLDGLPVAGLTGIAAGAAAFTPNYHIGDWGGGASTARFWKGKIDEFKVWKVALTAAEVQNSMGCSADPANANLVAHFPFDEKIAGGNNTPLGGNVATNKASNGASFNGTLTNMTQNGGSSNWVLRGAGILPACSATPFLAIEGNGRYQTAHRTKVFNGNIYSLGVSQPTGGNNFPVLTKRDAAGVIVWRHVLEMRGYYLDFEMTADGCGLLVVGHGPVFSGNNMAFITRVDDANGSLVWKETFDLQEREAFTRIVLSKNPMNPAFPYAILGIRKAGGTSSDDVQLFYIDGAGAIEPNPSRLNFADDQYHQDLEQMLGGYVLAGDIGAVGTLVFTDNALLPTAGFPSMRLTGSVVIHDVQPVGNFLFIAGRAANGGFLAKINFTNPAAPAFVWGHRYPTIPEFRKILVRPNGDIHAVGWRKPPVFSPAGTTNHTVIVKGKDNGPNGFSHTWLKYFYRAPETGWTLGDLVHYGPSSLFYTDGRLNNAAGYGSYDVFKALGNDDLTDLTGPCLKKDTVPNAKMNLQFTALNVARTAQTMPFTTGGVAFQQPLLMRDPCVAAPCECVFKNMGFSKGGVALFSNIPCGSPTIYDVKCPMQNVPIYFTGQLQCSGDDCSFNGISWTVKDPTGATVVSGGSTVSGVFSIGLTLAALQVSGTYTILLVGKCGTKTCECVIKFKVPPCEKPCDCTNPAFTNDVNMAFNYLQFSGGTCKFQFTPKKLTACDQVVWKWAKASDLIFTAFGTTTGNASITHSFLTSGSTQYVVCIDVTRTVPGTTPPQVCKASRCVLIDVDCSLLDGGVANRGGSICAGGKLENGGFLEEAEAGGLLSGGSVKSWNASAGEPELFVEAGAMDSNFIRVRGNAGFSDHLFQENLTITPEPMQLSVSFRPVFGSLVEGTELVVRLSKERLDSSDCTGSCLEFARIAIPTLDSASQNLWLTATANRWVESDFSFFTMHLENPFLEDDDALKSIVEIDNVCFRKVIFSGTSTENDDDDDAFKNVQFRLFPNPNQGDFRVEWQGFLIEKGQLEIVSSVGQTLRSWPISDGSKSFEARVGDLPEGIYFVKITARGQLLKALKFVKQ